MAKFFRYKDQYVNLDCVGRVELKRGRVNYIKVIAASDMQSILLSIEESDIDSAERTFCKLRGVLEAENLVN